MLCTHLLLLLPARVLVPLPLELSCSLGQALLQPRQRPCQCCLLLLLQRQRLHRDALSGDSGHTARTPQHPPAASRSRHAAPLHPAAAVPMPALLPAPAAPVPAGPSPRPAPPAAPQNNADAIRHCPKISGTPNNISITFKSALLPKICTVPRCNAVLPLHPLPKKWHCSNTGITPKSDNKLGATQSSQSELLPQISIAPHNQHQTPNLHGFPEQHHFPTSVLLPKCITTLLKPALPPQISPTPQSPPGAHLFSPQLLELSHVFLLGPVQGHHLLLCHRQPLPYRTQLLCQPHSGWGAMGTGGVATPRMEREAM